MGGDFERLISRLFADQRKTKIYSDKRLIRRCVPIAILGHSLSESHSSKQVMPSFGNCFKPCPSIRTRRM